ncbi:imelysin [Sinobacterium caligoides]|uniref:Imelysin n=1 Tax=Sinobacterium caligoides TaxID=933926 RepID=A0A3N2DJI5_9GAMM|nr:imelysin family protein [Sinobacterium caligoides]ROR99949.1 imelysin [Sinobacterium caligoides]
MNVLRPISAAVIALTASLSANAAVTKADVLENYTHIAHAVFEDSLLTAQALQVKIDALVKNPSEKTLNDAKIAWKQARVPYQQSEVYRFGNANVDDWEGQLNAWPLDEGMIDYTSKDYEYEMGNVGAQANIIANVSLNIGGETIDMKNITPELLASLNELGGSEANVASGYHAIEFLLWGQDLHGVNAGSGERPYTDYAQGKDCTNGNCERRGAYLQAAGQLLITDLQDMTTQWAAGSKDNYAAELIAGDKNEGITKMFFGMGSLALGELAGERMKVALEANSPEDEHDCFSDNTHYSHYYDAKGIKNIYLGEYQRVDGTVVKGASLAELVKAKDAGLNDKLVAALNSSESALQTMVDSAESKDGLKFDQMIAEGNSKGQKIITDAIAALVVETGLIEQAAKAVGVSNLNPDTADHQF